MRFRPRQGLLAGIAVLAAGSVVLEIALARTCAALLGPHFALAAPSLALAGVGLGGALLAALPGLVRRHALLSRLSYLAGLAAGATLAALLVLVHVKVPDALDRAAFGPVAAVYLTAALPFVLVGLAVAGAVRHCTAIAGRVVFATLGGAALGAPLAIVALRVGAPRAGLVVMVAYGVASLLFYLAARRAHPAVERPRGAVVATFVLASSVLLAGDLGAPWLRLPSLRFAPLDRVETQEWGALGFVTVDRAQAGISWMHTDGTAAVPIYDVKTAVPLAPEEMAYVLHRDVPAEPSTMAGHDGGSRPQTPGPPSPQAPAAILGGGGGREVRLALKYGQREIYAVDLDPLGARTLMLDRYKKAGGDVYENPAVKLALQDGRGYVRRAPHPFRSIVLALPDTAAAVGAGALAPEPMPLYTVEAFADLLEHLTPEGALAVTRWDGEVDRLVGLTAAALRQVGAVDPSQHLFACGASRSTTLLARRAPLSPADVAQLRGFCRKNKFTEAFAPDQSHGEMRRRVAVELDVAAAAAGQPTDLRPPTDDRPFFGYTVPSRLLIETLRGKILGVSGQGLVVLAGLVGVAVALLFFTVALPLVAWARPPAGRLRPLLYFFAVGASLAFALAGLAPRLTTLLGHPLCAFTTVVPALLAAVAAGGLVVRPGFRTSAPGAGVRAELLVVALAAAAVATGPILDAGLGLPFGLRVAAALALLMPIGLLGGSLLALGIDLVATPAPQLVPWCWGMAGAGAFAAVAAATPAAMILGYSPVLLVAGLLALVAAACVPRRAQLG